MTQLLLPFGLGIIMFWLGLGLTVKDFRHALGRPQAVVLGLVAQMLLLPLTAFLLAHLLDLEPKSAVGLMILAACPGGVMAGAMTRLARGETALSVSLSALTSLCAVVTVPLVLGLSLKLFLGESSELRVSLGPIIGMLLLVTVAPVSLGLWLRETGRATRKVRTRVRIVAAGAFFLIVIHTLAEHWPTVREHLPSVGPACLLLNLLTMATGAGLGMLARLDSRARIALAVECGFQNNALGITLAIGLLSQPELAIPSALYALVMYGTAFVVIVWRTRWPARPAS